MEAMDPLPDVDFVETTKRRAAADTLREKIINSKTGETQKRARAKEVPLPILEKRTQRLVRPIVHEAPKVEIKKPKAADLMPLQQSICQSLLVGGYVDSFMDFFRITHPKCPGSFHYDYWSNDHDAVAPPPEMDPSKFNWIKEKLVDAENARRAQRDVELARCYTELSQFFQGIKDMTVAITMLEKLRAYALLTSDLGKEALALREIARLFGQAGDIQASVHFCEECLQVCQSINDGVSEAQAALVTAYRLLSQQQAAKGDILASIEVLEKAAEVATKSGELKTLALVHHELGEGYRAMGDLESAVEHFSKAQQLYRGLGDFAGCSHSVSALASAYKLLGRTEEAVERFKELHDLANQTGSAKDKATSCLTMGKILWESDKREEALGWFQKNFDISLELDDVEVIEDSRVSLGVALADFRMKKFIDLARQPPLRKELLAWEVERGDGAFKA